MSRFVCNTLDEIDAAQRDGNFAFDLVIIGSGMYGAFTAAQVFELTQHAPEQRRPRILVLEAGPFLISEHVQNLAGMDAVASAVLQPVVDGNQAIEPHHRCVGGKSLFWGGWSPELSHVDNQDDLSFWPEEVREFLLSEGGYRRIADQIGSATVEDFIRGPLNDALLAGAQGVIKEGTVPVLTGAVRAPIAVQGQGPISGLFSMDKFSSLPLLMHAIRQDQFDAARCEGDMRGDPSRHLFLVPRTEVLRIETAEGRATGLVLAVRAPSTNADRPGLTTRIVRFGLSPAAMVCLAGNTINTTRLALNSLGKPAELGADLTGKNLMVHVRGNHFWRIRKSVLPPIPDTNDDSLSQSALHVEGRVPVGEPVGRLGRFHFQVYAVRADTNAAADSAESERLLYRSVPNLEDLDQLRESIHDTSMDDWIIVGIRTCGETFGDRQVDPSSAASSSISVGDGDDVYTDADGNEVRIPKAIVKLLERDVDTAVRDAQTAAAHDFIAALVDLPAEAARRGSDGEVLQLIKTGEDSLGSTYHESGTLWLGDDPSASVTDVHGRLHHMANIICVDQSLFPTVGSANPVPTGLALASRAAQHIVDRLVSVRASPLQDGFSSLFDGTLDGWEKVGDGTVQPLAGLDIIECGSPGADSVLGYLRTTDKFRNFVLRLDWKAFDIRANSGIFLRMPDLTADGLDEVYRNSIEIQIDETGRDFDATRNPQSVYGSSLHKTGAVYGMAPATRWAAKSPSPRGPEDHWNAYEIEVHGDRVRVRLNGELVAYHGELPAHLQGSGYIGLQCHTDVVQFRNIQIRELEGG
jgi:hypothetical protein